MVAQNGIEECKIFSRYTEKPIAVGKTCSTTREYHSLLKQGTQFHFEELLMRQNISN
jgi:hypothetical protein